MKKVMAMNYKQFDNMTEQECKELFESIPESVKQLLGTSVFNENDDLDRMLQKILRGGDGNE